MKSHANLFEDCQRCLDDSSMTAYSMDRLVKFLMPTILWTLASITDPSKSQYYRKYAFLIGDTGEFGEQKGRVSDIMQVKALQNLDFFFENCKFIFARTIPS